MKRLRLRWTRWPSLLLGCGALWPPCAPAAGAAAEEYQAVLQARPDSVHGESLFRVCSDCHGVDAGGVDDGSVPALAAQHFHVIAHELVDYRHDRRWDLRMEHFSDSHHLRDAQDIADVAAYLSALPPVAPTGIGDGEFLQHGAQVYARLCAVCHGAAGQGEDGQRYPRLAGQHYEYLVRQLHDAVEGRRPNFPAEHVALLRPLERADIMGLADYLARLGSDSRGARR